MRKLLHGNELEPDPQEWHQTLQEQRIWDDIKLLAWLVVMAVVLALLLKGCEVPAHAEEIPLKASWYSIESLKREGTYKHSKGVMANGHIFSDSGYTCATRLFPLGSTLRVNMGLSKAYVIVKVTDRIGKRFSKTRIDLSRAAFQRIANLKQGLINVEVERI